ncbi:MAG: hypothetical protein LKE33_01890 [Acidaminococcus sp.]|jgi:transcriptional regulator with XRE-family HTH domain|nr:hypothetical protein [Acidaminococcus sp.]
MDIKDIFSRRFILLKECYRLSYSQIADIIGAKSKNTVNDWVKSQKGFPNETMLVNISQVFAVSLDWLLGNVEYPYREDFLRKLEKQYVLPYYEESLRINSGMAILAPNLEIESSSWETHFSIGQRANLIFCAMSDIYLTENEIKKLPEVPPTSPYYAGADDTRKAALKHFGSALINEGDSFWFKGMKSISDLLRGNITKEDYPPFDLETAIKNE